MIFKKKVKRQSRRFEFTDKGCREFKYCGVGMYSDSLCKNLRFIVSENGNHSYAYQNQNKTKVIGSVYSVTVKEAREITRNLNENREDFLANYDTIKLPLSIYIKKNGFFPHCKGTETILSEENSSLKQKIKDLQEEIERLIQKNIKLNSRLMTISHLVNHDEDDLEMCD